MYYSYSILAWGSGFFLGLPLGLLGFSGSVFAFFGLPTFLDSFISGSESPSFSSNTNTEGRVWTHFLSADLGLSDESDCRHAEDRSSIRSPYVITSKSFALPAFLTILEVMTVAMKFTNSAPMRE